jgi:glucose-6-phosphate isomerase
MAGLAEQPQPDVADYEDFSRRVKGQNFSDAVVLGMGGSSLGPEVLAETFARKSGFPKLHVLDSTDPAQVRAMEASVDLAHTLFIVSSKSGGTTEPNVMKDYFFDRVSKTIGKDKAGHRFIAVTIPARRWRRSRPSRVLRASSMAIPPSADVTPCCRRSAWCRPPPRASMCAT